MVVRIDRLARSLTHLLEVIERLRAQGRAFPEPWRSDRHREPAGHLHPAGAGRRGRAGAGADPRAHQGRAQGGQGRGRVGGNPGLARVIPQRASQDRRCPGHVLFAGSAAGARRMAARRAPAAAGAALGGGGAGRNAALPLVAGGLTRDLSRGAGGPFPLTPAPRRPRPDRTLAILAGIASSRSRTLLSASTSAELPRVVNATSPQQPALFPVFHRRLRGPPRPGWVPF